MTFEEFQKEVGEGSVLTIGGRLHYVLLSKTAVVVVRPHGSFVYHGNLSASVAALTITSNNFESLEVEICR